MKLNKSQKQLVDSYSMGYRVDELGNLRFNNKQLNPYINPQGYKVFNPRINGKKRLVTVHRLQAYQKYGNIIFDKGVVVRHKNGVSTDNSKTNILIGSQLDNIMDRSEKCRSDSSSNPKHNHKKILEDYGKGLTYSELMIKYKISSKGTISYIINCSNSRMV